ncbi:MAG: HAMP domain-containing protein, partial [Gemmatimonadaceae bacterium]
MIKRAFSIRRRLALWYGCSMLLVFLAAGLALRLAVRRVLLAEFDNDALDSSTLVGHFFHVEAAEYPTVQQAVTDLVGEIVYADRKIEFIRPDGRVLTPLAAVPDTTLRLAPPLRTLTVILDSSRAPGWSMRIISSAADLEQTLHEVDEWFLFGAPFIAGLAVVLGWTLAGRLLRPVESMALAAERITVADPSGRLPVLNPNDEVGRLGG